MYVATRRFLAGAEELERDPSPLLRTSIAEVFRDRGTVDRHTAAPTWVTFRLAGDVVLLDLADSDWLPQAGGNGAISSGLRSRARDWSRAVYAHYGDALDGLYYASSHVPAARSVAFYERAATKLPARPALLIEYASAKLDPELEEYAGQLRLDLI